MGSEQLIRDRNDDSSNGDDDDDDDDVHNDCEDDADDDVSDNVKGLFQTQICRIVFMAQRPAI